MLIESEGCPQLSGGVERESQIKRSVEPNMEIKHLEAELTETTKKDGVNDHE